MPIAMGDQTISTRELVRLGKKAEGVGTEFVQVSPHSTSSTRKATLPSTSRRQPTPTIWAWAFYNTFWTSLDSRAQMVGRMAEIPNVVGLKWAPRDVASMIFEQAKSEFAITSRPSTTRYVRARPRRPRLVSLPGGARWRGLHAPGASARDELGVLGMAQRSVSEQGASPRAARCASATRFLALKEPALARTTPSDTKSGRSRPPIRSSPPEHTGQAAGAAGPPRAGPGRLLGGARRGDEPLRG